MPVKKRRLGSSENGCHRRSALALNDAWALDFVSDRTASGSPLKSLSIVDEYTRECVTLKVGRGISSEGVIEALSDLFAMRGLPRHIRCDKGLRVCFTGRSFAHVSDTGGARRTWLRGLTSVAKRHLMMVAARNLSTIMRAIIGTGGPRSLQGFRALLQTNWTHFDRLISALKRLIKTLTGYGPNRSTAVGG